MNKYLLILMLAPIVCPGCTAPAKPAQIVASPQATTSITAAELGIVESDELSLAQALALTLDRNPELKSYSQAVRASEARVIQAGLIPNPELSLQVEDMFGPYGRDHYSQATLQLSQIVELGGKRSARTDVASAVSGQSENDYQVKRIEILSGLTEKYIRTVADEHLLKLAKRGEEIARSGLQNIQKRAQAGSASELEEAKARVLLARAHIESEHAEHVFLTSKRELARFWGAELPTFSKISTDLFQPMTLPTFEELNARVEQSLEIQKWANEKRLREAEKKLAESKSVPNLTLSAGPRHFDATNDQSFVFQISLPLNVFDHNQGGRQEAAILNDKVALDESASLVRLKATLFGLYQEAAHAKTELDAMKSEIVPQAERSLKAAQNGFDQGRFSYLDLLDAQRTLLEVSRENIEAAYTFHSITNSIERLLGAPLNKRESL